MAGNRLQHLTPNDWILIEANALRRKFKLGEEIIRQGARGEAIFIFRRGAASVELAGTGTRTIVATLGPDDICGEMAFLQQGTATAAVVAREDDVEVDELNATELRSIFQAFPGLASRFYHSLASLLANRLQATSKELAREMALRDRKTDTGS
jgi:CRP-like cAMP-binding protein